jgi:hypothetical protein
MTSRKLEDLISKYNHIQACSFDAGGGNVLASLSKDLDIVSSFIVDGPALNIYSTLFPDLHIFNRKTLDVETDLLISSTGWQSSLEYKTMEMALSKGIPVIAVLDHWVTYLGRFEREGKVINPTYFLAFDDASENKINQEFASPEILRTENRYLARTLSEIRDLRTISNLHTYDFTFIGEPLSRSSEYPKWSEYNAMDHFFEVLRIYGYVNSRIAIKPHPAEDSKKYDLYIPNDFNNVEIIYGENLSKILAETDSVVGCHSMALYIAELSGNNVYTALPEGILPRVPLNRAQPITKLSPKAK